MWLTSQAQESSGIKTIDLWYQTTVCQTLPCQRVRPRAATCTNNGSGVMMISRRCSWRLWIFYLELWKIFFGCDGDTRDEGHSWALMDMNSNKSINQLMYDVCIAFTIQWFHQKWVEKISQIFDELFLSSICSLHRDSNTGRRRSNTAASARQRRPSPSLSQRAKVDAESWRCRLKR